MAECIKRDALLEARELAICAYENARVFNADAIRKYLKPLLDAVVDTPAADVAEVVHGRWLEEKRQTLLPVEYDDAGEPILHGYVVYRCNRCGRICKQKEPYCHCGAKMEDEVNE